MINRLIPLRVVLMTFFQFNRINEQFINRSLGLGYDALSQRISELCLHMHVSAI